MERIKIKDFSKLKNSIRKIKMLKLKALCFLCLIMAMIEVLNTKSVIYHPGCGISPRENIKIVAKSLSNYLRTTNYPTQQSLNN